MSKHTPGPWVFLEQGDANAYAILTHNNRWVIAFSQNGELWTDEQHANTRLIAAAPEMYDICKTFVERVEKGEVRSKKTYAAMKAVLNKIEGKSDEEN